MGVQTHHFTHTHVDSCTQTRRVRVIPAYRERASAEKDGERRAMPGYLT